jgi:hypothetical protein
VAEDAEGPKGFNWCADVLSFLFVSEISIEILEASISSHISLELVMVSPFSAYYLLVDLESFVVEPQSLQTLQDCLSPAPSSSGMVIDDESSGYISQYLWFVNARVFVFAMMFYRF